MNKQQIRAIIDSGYKASFIITGGGISAISNLTQYGGASNFLLSAHVPYCKESFKDFTGRVDDFVSFEACGELTRKAFYEARSLSGSQGWYFGVGATAKLTYDGERENRNHKIIIGIYRNIKHCAYYSYDLSKFPSYITRESQEELCGNLILITLCKVMNIVDIEGSYLNKAEIL